MMRFFFSLLGLLLLTTEVFAQSFYEFNQVTSSEGVYHYAGNTIETDDNNIIVIEESFTENSDIGVHVLKLNQELELIDSTSIQFTSYSHSNSPLIKNPFENDSYILAGFYQNYNDLRYHYNAIFFNGKLEVIDEIDVVIPYEDISLQYHRIFYDDSRNEFIVWCSSSLYNEEVTYLKMDIYGKVKTINRFDSSVLEEMSITDKPIFILNQNPLQYGIIYYRVINYDGNWLASDCAKLVAVLDENLNTTDIRLIEQIGIDNYKFHRTETSTIGLKDGNFIMACAVYVYYGSEQCVLLIKYDKDFNVLGYYTTPKYWITDIYSDVSHIIESKDGGIYIIWSKYYLNSYKYSINVSRLDNNMNLQWESDIQDIERTTPSRIADVRILENGGLLFAGTTMRLAPPESTLCFVINNDYTLTSEYPSSSDNLTIYPNPAQNIVKLSSSNGQMSMVKIYNTLGMLVDEIEVNSNEIEINVSDYNPGVYFFSVDGETVKVIKN